jgi:hypothetical protein
VRPRVTPRVTTKKGGSYNWNCHKKAPLKKFSGAFIFVEIINYLVYTLPITKGEFFPHLEGA